MTECCRIATMELQGELEDMKKELLCRPEVFKKSDGHWLHLGNAAIRLESIGGPIVRKNIREWLIQLETTKGRE